MSEAATILRPSRPPQLPSPEFVEGVSHPGTLMCPDGVVFASTRRTLLRFLFEMAERCNERPRPPRMYVLDGRPGTGKTVSVHDILSRAGYAVFALPTMASKHEGESVEQLRSILIEAQRYSALHRCRMAGIADDFDLSNLFAEKATGKTVNSNLNIRCLQELSDSGEFRNFAGDPIPLLFTGNDFSHGRSSLFRPGRAIVHTHEPSVEEKRAVVMRLFKPHAMRDTRHLERLAHRYRHESLVFWAEIKRRLEAERLNPLFDTDVIDADAVRAAYCRPAPLDVARLGAVARELSTSRFRNFL